MKPEPMPVGELLGDDARFDELMKHLKARSLGRAVSASEWQEVEDFINENIMTEERIMKEYECGKAAGAEEARHKIKNHLLNLAADQFKTGNDTDAKQLRAIAALVLQAK